MMNIFVREGDYINGLYHNFILQEHSTEFLTNTEAMLWYGHLAQTTSGKKMPYSTTYRKKEGEIQQLYYLLRKMDDEDLAVLATKEIWESSLKHPKNNFLKTMRSYVLRDFVSYDENKINSFATQPPSNTAKVIEKPKKKLSKYDKIKKKRQMGDKGRDTYYALLDIVDDDVFKNEYEKAKEYLDEQEDDNKIEEDSRDKPIKNSLDINDLIMVTPIYNIADSRKSVKKNINKNDLSSSNLTTMVKQNADKLDIKLHFVNDFGSNDFNTESYNQFSSLYDYLAERSTFKGEDFMPYNASKMSTLMDHYNSNYVGLVGIYTEVDRREFSGSTMLTCMLLYPLFPFYLKWQLTPDRATDYGFYVYNLKTHNPTFTSSKYFNANMKSYLQNAHIYNSLNQITK